MSYRFRDPSTLAIRLLALYSLASVASQVYFIQEAVRASLFVQNPTEPTPVGFSALLGLFNEQVFPAAQRWRFARQILACLPLLFASFNFLALHERAGWRWLCLAIAVDLFRAGYLLRHGYGFVSLAWAVTIFLPLAGLLALSIWRRRQGSANLMDF